MKNKLLIAGSVGAFALALITCTPDTSPPQKTL
jgi:hypothetical protein